MACREPPTIIQRSARPYKSIHRHCEECNDVAIQEKENPYHLQRISIDYRSGHEAIVNIFVTGSDTDIGKTIVSTWLCMHTSANYWKPIQTGDDSDRNTVEKLSSHTKIIPEVYKLKAPLSPYDAAKLENREISTDLFDKNLDNTVIEGAGGALVPIAANFLMVDLLKMCRAKALIVVQSKLGMINQALMTVEVFKKREVDIIGIVINGSVEEDIMSTIESFSEIKVLAVIQRSSNLFETLRQTSLPSEILDVIK